MLGRQKKYLHVSGHSSMVHPTLILNSPVSCDRWKRGGFRQLSEQMAELEEGSPAKKFLLELNNSEPTGNANMKEPIESSF